MPKNFAHQATITSSTLTFEGSIRTINITNLSSNVVYVRVSESGPATVGSGVVLPFQYATFSYNDPSMALGPISVISVGGPADLSIFAA